MDKDKGVRCSYWSLAVAPLLALGTMWGATFALLSAVTPSPALSQDYSATPTPTPTPTKEPSSASQLIGPEGGTIVVRGGILQDGGMSVVFPRGSVITPVKVTVTLVDTQPAGGSVSGGVLLPKTIDILFDERGVLRGSYEFQVNLTAMDLETRSIESIKGAWVRPDGQVVPCPTQVLDTTQGIIAITSVSNTKFTLFSQTVPGPALSAPADGVLLTGLGTTLTWSLPPGSTQYQLLVAPFNIDGPAISLIRNAEASYTIQPPDFGALDSSYVMLPDMTYLWRVRSTTSTKPPAELADLDWTAWSIRAFRTKAVTSSTISSISPETGTTVGSVTPTLVWTNTDKTVFYYEVQVSKDPNFGTGPGAPFLYWALVHGGTTDPLNSYTVPDRSPLEPGMTYYWRVRPRVQGDGVPVTWWTPIRVVSTP